MKGIRKSAGSETSTRGGQNWKTMRRRYLAVDVPLHYYSRTLVSDCDQWRSFRLQAEREDEQYHSSTTAHVPDDAEKRSLKVRANSDRRFLSVPTP